MSVQVISDRTKEVLAGISDGLSDGLYAIGLEIETGAKKRITSGPKSGRVYARSAIRRKYAAKGKRAAALRAMGGRGKTVAGGNRTSFVTGYRIHRASREGEAPANDIGALAASLRTIRISKKRVETVAGEEYAPVLEERRNRPFLRPAAEEVEDRAESIVILSIEKKVPGL